MNLDKEKGQQSQIERLGRNINRLDSKSRKISVFRLIIFLSGLAGITSFYWIDRRISGLFLIATIVIFAFIAWQHRRVERMLKRFRIRQEFARDTLARMKIDWPGIPEAKHITVEKDHPFDQDVSVTGQYSLHRLLDICLTKEGSLRLADWLLNTKPDPDVIRRRQKIVRDIKKRRFFRHGLRLNFRLVSQEQLWSEKVRSWLAHTKSSKRLLLLSIGGFLLCCLNIFLIVWSRTGPSFWGYGLALYAAFVLWNRDVWFHLGDDAAFLDMEFKGALAIFRFLESYSYKETPELGKLCSPFQDLKSRPTRQLRHFMLLAVLVGLRMNYLTAVLFNIFFPYDFLIALLFNRQKQHASHHFESWLNAVHELDALLSIANFSAINDHAVFPDIIADSKNPRLSAEELGHPFIPEKNRVCNDFVIRDKASTVLITGSNMSGKSTFLRTVGINLVLAYAGAPVFASKFSVSLLNLFCCIQINDSITDGVSQFYAEVKRLRQLQDEFAVSAYPVLYLIDEIFKGTNNRERLIGSQAFISSLSAVNGLGLISTHDLELSRLKNIRNVHFREHVKAGKLVFDYKLFDGPCPTTNALKIMQLEGLPVGDGEGTVSHIFLE